MLNYLADAFGTATFAWTAYYALSFFGFEYAADLTLIPVFLFSLVALTSLPICGLIWAAKHVRVTII